MTQTLSVRAAVDMLEDLVSYRQVDYWIREHYITIEQPATGCGSRRALNTTDILRIRAIGYALAAGFLRNEVWRIADQVNAADPATLTTSLDLTLGPRATASIDLTIDANDPIVLRHWIERHEPAATP